MNSEKYTLFELANTYLRYVSCSVLDLSRTEIHEAIYNKLNIDYDTRFSNKNSLKVDWILHHLDEEIGLIIGIEYDEADFEKMTKKLVRKIKNIGKEVKQ